ncbi:MAG: STAS domain-containing protein [Thermodesulfobacteriota bacterium]
MARHDASNPAELRLEGELTVWRAGELRNALATALASGTDVALDLGGVEAADAAGLQLLCAVHQTAAARGHTLRVRLGAAVSQAAQRAGLRPRVGCRSGCLWTGEEG